MYINIYIQVARVPRIIHNVLRTYVYLFIYVNVYIYVYILPIAYCILPIAYCSGSLPVAYCSGGCEKWCWPAQVEQQLLRTGGAAVYETWSRDVVVFTRIFF